MPANGFTGRNGPHHAGARRILAHRGSGYSEGSHGRGMSKS
jgi:hypothetical protein